VYASFLGETPVRRALFPTRCALLMCCARANYHCDFLSDASRTFGASRALLNAPRALEPFQIFSQTLEFALQGCVSLLAREMTFKCHGMAL